MLDLFILAAMWLLILGALACAVLFVRLAWLGVRFWLLTGSLESAHRIVDAQIALDEQTDQMMRAGMYEAEKRGWLPGEAEAMRNMTLEEQANRYTPEQLRPMTEDEIAAANDYDSVRDRFYAKRRARFNDEESHD